MSPKQVRPYHERSVFGGFVWGAIFASVAMLFWGPRFPWGSIKQAQESVREKIDQTVNADPVNEGIQQGKDVARKLMRDNQS